MNLGMAADFSSDETRMVSPYSVMPVTLIQVPYDKSEFISLEKQNKINLKLPGIRKADACIKPITLKTSRGLRTLTPESVGIFTEQIKEEIPDVEIKVEDVLIEDFDDYEATVPRAVIVKSANFPLIGY